MKGRFLYIVLILLAVSLTRCANVVAPTGGAKDTTPPKVVEALPANHSSDFDGNKIEITFDEFVTLNNANQQVLVSPPSTTKPDIKLSNKTVSIKFKEDLKPNTTYTIHFGEAVKDFHEGNLFKDYYYSFSTGAVLDTLSLTGKVVNADDKKPAADLYVSLYAASDSLHADSLFLQPLRRMPDFITKTDKEGSFVFQGLPNRDFLVFALEDMNANLFYDLPNEKVAFLDSLVAPTDSISLTLYAFTEIDTTQMLLENKLVEEGLIRFVFRHPATQLTVKPISTLVDSFQMVEVWSNEHDTLCWFFTPNIMDSLSVEIHSEVDTLINNKSRLSLHYKNVKSRNDRNDRTLKVNTNLKNHLLMPGEDLLLRFNEPIVDFRLHDTSTFIAGTDTTYNTLRFEQTDTYGMEYRLVATIEDTLNYALNLVDSVFYSVRHRTNKSINLKFRRATDTDFGAIAIKVCPPELHQAVVQLLNNKGAVVAQHSIDSTGTVTFGQLMPEKYRLQAIIDADQNGKWSTGNFHRRALPETVIPYKDELDVKAGWDINLDEIWLLKP